MIADVFNESGAFNTDWTPDTCIVALMRKYAYVAANKYMKDNEIIARYKHNYLVKEVFESGYKKTTSTMVLDLVRKAFEEISNLIEITKVRGDDAYQIIFTTPMDQRKRDALEDALLNYQNLHPQMMYFYRYDLRPGRKVRIVCHFDALSLFVRTVPQIQGSISFPEYKEKIVGLVEILKAALLPTPVAPPAPVAVNVTV